jgi:hypothetical protein
MLRPPTRASAMACPAARRTPNLWHARHGLTRRARRRAAPRLGGRFAGTIEDDAQVLADPLVLLVEPRNNLLVELFAPAGARPLIAGCEPSPRALSSGTELSRGSAGTRSRCSRPGSGRRDRFPGTSARRRAHHEGAAPASVGRVDGYYLFKRNEANKEDLVDPWEVADEQVVELADQIDEP